MPSFCLSRQRIIHVFHHTYAVPYLSSLVDSACIYAYSLYTCSNITDNKGDSALTSVRFPLQLLGRSIISRNTGGGLSLLDARIDLGGIVLFESNSAVDGGAIAMEDESLVCANK